MPANVESMFSVRRCPGTAKARSFGLPRLLGRRPHARGTELGPGQHRRVRGRRDQPGRHRTLRARRRVEGHQPLRHRRHPVGQPGNLHGDRPRRDGRDRRGRPRPAQRQVGDRRSPRPGPARSGAWPCWTSRSTLPGIDSPTMPYLAITNRHDGTAACALRATAVRIVCANTFRAAELEGERTGATFSFIHRSSWRTGSRKPAAPSPAPGRRSAATPNLPEAAGDTHHAEAAGAVRHRVRSRCHPPALVTDRVAAMSRKPARRSG